MATILAGNNCPLQLLPPLPQLLEVWLKTNSCYLGHMHPDSARSFNCSYVGGQAVIPVQAAFGGWAMYPAALLRSSSNRSTSAGPNAGDGTAASDLLPNRCRHVPNGDCEHISLSDCLRSRGVKQIIVTGLVVDWEGCNEELQARGPCLPIV